MKERELKELLMLNKFSREDLLKKYHDLEEARRIVIFLLRTLSRRERAGKKK